MTVYGRFVTIHQLKTFQPGDELELEDLGNEGDGVYEVDEILDHDGPVASRSYLIKWKYYSHAHNSWESEKDTETSADLKKAYWNRNTRYENIDRATNVNPIFQMKRGMRARQPR
jgi:hypothetical protein